MLRLAFEGLRVYRVQAMCVVPNLASERVMQKLGMQFEGILRGRLFQGPDHDVKMCAILRPEWPAAGQASRGRGCAAGRASSHPPRRAAHPSGRQMIESRAAATPAAPTVRAGPALLVLCAAVFLGALDQTVVVTALDRILGDFSIPTTQLDHAAWIISGYLLGYVVAMPLFGRIGDRFGRREALLAGFALFLGGSAACSMAGSLWPLVAARVVQAAGAGALVPVAMAAVADLYPRERRAVPLGILGAAAEAGGALGPLWGAFLVQHWGWRIIFQVNVPAAALLLVLAWWLVPRGGRDAGGVDVAGAVLIGASLTFLAMGLARSRRPDGSLGAGPCSTAGCWWRPWRCWPRSRCGSGGRAGR